MGNLALFLIRATLGLFMAGHGAQKLFGSFGGPGIEGTAGFMESLGLKPGKQWAVLGGASEFGGGMLTLLGLLSPLGSLGVIGSMAIATTKVHWNNPIWVTEGGAEFPVTNIGVATALMMTGPGAISLDRAFGIRVPRWISFFGLVSVALILAHAWNQEASAQPEEPPEGQDG
ncbi:MAG: DoxX family protein [Rubrobacteraceae bacterium]